MDAKFDCLEKIYALLDRETRGYSLACGDRCPDCCTCNVTATRLEVAYMKSRLDKAAWDTLTARLEARFPEKRFVPRVTLNGFAKACVENLDLPEEENDPDWGPCPLLAADRCSVYAVRPLGCRVMMSKTHCREEGMAQMPPLVLTLSNILGQFVEALDTDGFSGNLSDLLSLFSRSGGDFTLDNPDGFDRKGIFLRNQPIPVLMVPPEHRAQMAPIISQIQALHQEALALSGTRGPGM